MRNSVFLSRRAEKFLAGLRDAKLYGRLRAVIDDLEQMRALLVARNLLANLICIEFESGDYRIIYQVNDPKLTVLVLSIAHRREIYRQ